MEGKKSVLKFLFGSALLFTLAITSIGQSIYTRLLTQYPQEWLMVSPGMSSEDARAILGKPYADGEGLKIVDRWIIRHRGVTLHLDLWFRGEEAHDSEGKRKAISRVSRFKRFSGKNTEKHVDPPW